MGWRLLLEVRVEVTTLLSPTSASLALLWSPLSRIFRVCSRQVATCLQPLSCLPA